MKKYLTIISLVLLAGSAQASASEGNGLTYDPLSDYYELDSETQAKPAEGPSTQVTEQSQRATGMQWPEGL